MKIRPQSIQGEQEAKVKTAMVWIAVLLVFTGISQAQKPLVLSKSLPTHGTLMMEMNFGEIRIVRCDEARTIRLSIDSHNQAYDAQAMQSWVRRFEVTGDRAAIAMKLPQDFRNNKTSPRVTVYLPAYTDLKLQLGAGQITVKGIEGNKDLHVNVGQLTVNIADGAEYSEIRTSSKLGETNDEVSHKRSDGFFPSTDHVSSQGLYKLYARVDIGEVKVERD
jgi:hypothetical protein